LCWVLQHRHNSTFAKNLNAIEEELLERGMVVRRADGPSLIGAPPDSMNEVITAERLATILQNLLRATMDQWNDAHSAERALHKLPWHELDPISRQLYVERAERFLSLFHLTERRP